MPIITISRGSHSRGGQIAEKVATILGYECVSREILLETSQHFNIPETKLVRALHDGPSVLERFTYGKERYVAFIAEALLEHVQKDNVVYHGLAGQFFLTGVSHVLKVRILADMEDRVSLVVERDGVSADAARRTIKKDDEERYKWAHSLYGVDTSDPVLYDLVIHVRQITVDDAADIICHTAKLPHFQATAESQAAMNDLVLAAQARGVIVEDWPSVTVSAENGIVTARIEAPLTQETAIREAVSSLLAKVPGVKEPRVHVVPNLS